MIRVGAILFLAAVQSVAATTVSIAVKGADGKPLPAVPVVQVELERDNIAVQPVGQTNAEGKLALDFDQRTSVKGGDRGYGVYRFVLTPKERPWALSDIYIWYPDPARAKTYVDPSFLPGRYEFTNWQYGQRRVLAKDAAVEWSPALPDKRSVAIAVYDDWGFPIPGAEIRVSVDLCALSHTGFGGAIPFESFTADKDGRFTIPNAGDFFYSFDIVENTGKTIASNRYIAPDHTSYNYTVMRQLSSSSAVVLYHRLVNLPLTVDVADNATGKAVPNAAISQVIQFPSTAQGGPLGPVDKNGHYHTDTFHPEHTIAIVATADGYEMGSVPYSPSQEHYTFPLTPNGREKKGK